MEWGDEEGNGIEQYYKKAKTRDDLIRHKIKDPIGDGTL